MYPTWVNLYRLPYSERSGMFATGGEGQLSEYSEYSGRIQLAISTSITDDPIMEERACRPVALPPTAEWHLHCDIHMASGLVNLMGWSKNFFYFSFCSGLVNKLTKLSIFMFLFLFL